MNILTKEQINYIEDNLIYSHKIEYRNFVQLNSEYELEYIIQNYNWDNGLELIKWISNSNLCSLATAVRIFWLCNPTEYLKSDLKENTISENIETFEIIKIILNNLSKGFYKESDIKFDPTSYVKKIIFPEFMMEKTNGEKPYLYFNESEYEYGIKSNIEEKIIYCNDAMELFSIAYFTKEPLLAELILNNKHCDKAIAKMLFWRLETFCSLWTKSSFLKKQIILDFRNNKLKEKFEYDPIKDSNIKILKKNKWEIPEITKEKI